MFRSEDEFYRHVIRVIEQDRETLLQRDIPQFMETGELSPYTRAFTML